MRKRILVIDLPNSVGTTLREFLEKHPNVKLTFPESVEQGRFACSSPKLIDPTKDGNRGRGDDIESL